MFPKTGFYNSRQYNGTCFLRDGWLSDDCLSDMNDMKKKSKEFWVPTGLFPKTVVAENSLSEPFKDIFTNNFNTVDFCTDYWDWYLVFHPSWCPCWKALIWCMGECSSVPYLAVVYQKQNYH